MFIHQKNKYEIIKSLVSFKKALDLVKPKHLFYDTETTGIHPIKDKPFLVGVGFEEYLYYTDDIHALFKVIFMYEGQLTLWAHNAKFDYHMLKNIGITIPEHIKLADSLALARLTQYADDRSGIGLESLGQRYVDDEAKFAGKVIKNHVNKINAARLKTMKTAIKKEKLPGLLSEVMTAYRNRVQFIPHEWDELFFMMDLLYVKPTYEDSYKEEPELMINYLLDDIVIMREFILKALPVLEQMGENLKIFEQENKLIRVVGEMERNGVKADVNYLVESRERVLKYKNELYLKLRDLTGYEFTAGQHKFIKGLLQNKYKIIAHSVNVEALETIIKEYDGEVVEVCKIILKLRTVDKWLSTYIEGKLNKVHNGRIYTSINNSGTVTGRVSSDLQQEPKEALFDEEGNELFHPRRAVVNDKGYHTFYFDFSQMELRVQAQYTVDISGGDLNLCRAYTPFKYYHEDTKEQYDMRKNFKEWNSGKWVDEEGNHWIKTDLHDVTTLQAFPELGSKDHPDFKKYRKHGKMCNFLKNYGGGIGAIMSQMNVNEEIANKLNQGYYAAFPKVLDYQGWVEQQLTQNGYVANIYGRRYYLQDSNFYYKAYNYLIQGGCADMVKQKEIKIYELLRDYDSHMLLPVHDEIQVNIKEGEEHLVPLIKEIMEDTADVLPDIPMICDVEITHGSWADKIDYK